MTGPSRRWPFLAGRGGGSPWSSDGEEETGRDILSGRSAGNRDGKAGTKSVCSRYGLCTGNKQQAQSYSTDNNYMEFTWRNMLACW